MKTGSGLVSGPHPTQELAERAVRKALSAAGLERAACVILFLTRDFLRHAQPAVIAAARAAGCMQVFGSTANGLFTEHDMLFDQAGAAALVIASDEPISNHNAPIVSFCGHGALPFDWQAPSPVRVGLIDSDAQTWAHGRLAGDTRSECRVPGGKVNIALSTGLRLISDALAVDACDAYELRAVGGMSAIASLRHHLPPELREHLPLHQIALLRSPTLPGIGILSTNADGSLTLAEALHPGDSIRWAVRQPLAAEQDMRQSLSPAGGDLVKPDFGLMFSCIGRGPLFYGGEDRDRLAFCEQFPGVPLLGAYGSGQIAPVEGKNSLFQNSVITLLIEGTHV